MSAKVCFTGNLVRDPEMRKIGESNAATFCVGVRTPLKDADGTYKSNFYDCTLFGKRADYVMAHGQKGSLVFVAGDFALSEYKNKNGEDRTSLRVTVDTVDLLARTKGWGDDTAPAQTNTTTPPPMEVDNTLPF